MEICGVNIMNNIKPFTFYDFISIVGCIGFIIVLYFAIPPDKYNLYDYLKSKRLESCNQKYQQHLLTCIYCKGSGQRVEDTNRTIFMAKVQLYLNKHLMVDKCTKCTKLEHGDGYIYCDEANSQYSVFLHEYGVAGPKFEKTMCSECMGCGQFTIQNRDGSYVTQEEYEQEEKEKQGE